MHQMRMKSPTDIRRTLTRVSNWVLEGRITPQQGNCITGCANAILNSIRVDEQDKRIAELEAVLERIEDEKA